tara:strand:+ start:449 stop:610 length:162 start_codon:yes stop_codon:yes gene_type:complete
MSNKEINELYEFFNKLSIKKANWDKDLQKKYIENKKRLSQLYTELNSKEKVSG